MMTEFAVLGDDGRFEIRNRLGSGGMGVVYEAFDRHRSQLVALKKLLDHDAASIYRLKQEFRSLADVAHPNLVSLYELIGEGEDWFFTMELVTGTDFLHYVRPPAPGIAVSDAAPTERATTEQTLRRFEEADLLAEIESAPRPPMTPCVTRLDLLRQTLLQITEGVAALHRAGKLHRDLKPSNVLITPQRRVVILDFGLTTDVVPGRHLTLAGTPVYMSPEQIAEHPATEASDWYGVGVMLFEALTGVLPFTGNLYSIMMQKQTSDAPAPAEFVEGVPESLNSLCVDLLQRAPETRPLADEILHRLSESVETLEPRVVPRHTTGRDAPFVGRTEELDALRAALETTKSGRPVTMVVSGASGMGKSTLVRHFLDEARHEDPSLIVFNGRCYEQESVPYKAVDSLIDDLMQYLRTLNSLEAKAILPTDALALARLFPVLNSIEAVNKGRRRVDIIDSQELRRRAFAALREMMARIVDEHPVALFLDDLQWGDRDSAALIGELLRPPEAPALLLIACHRRDGTDSSPFLAELRKLREDRALGEVGDIAIGELQGSDARDLVRAVVGRDAPADRIEAIAREAAGSPFFIQELGRLTSAEASEGNGSESDTTNLDDLIRARVAKLPEHAQDFLEVIAVAGQPVDTSIAHAASSVGGDLQPLVAVLRAEHLARTRLRAGREEIVTYHDRVREAVLDELSDVRLRRHHRALAAALAEQEGDPELLAIHFHGANEDDRAAVYALKAADNAAAALAFDHAARLYRFALDLESDPNPPVARIVQLADALANAGRGSEAAYYYLRAAGNVDSFQALEMKRRAAAHLLRSGHVDEGLRIIRDVLASIGMSYPASKGRTLVSILARRLVLLVRGRGYHERAPEDVSPDLLMKADVCWTAMIGLARIDNFRSAYFQTMFLGLALKSGDLYRILGALLAEAGFAAIKGGKGKRKAEAILADTEQHTRRLMNPHIIGLRLLDYVLIEFYQGNFRAALRRAEEADATLRERCTGVTWELDTCQTYAIRSLEYLGEIEQLSRRVPPLLRDAQERGDLYAATDLAGIPNILWLAKDEPETAGRMIRSAIEQWSLESFHFQHYIELAACCQIDLYAGRAHEAWQRIEERWPALQQSMNLRIQFIRIEALHLRGRCGLAAAAETGDQDVLSIVDREAGRIIGEGMSWGLPLGQSLRAGVMAVRGDLERSRMLFTEAAKNFEKAEMALYAAATRRRLGELTGGDDGARAIAAADEWMSAQGIKVPERLTNVLMAPLVSGTGVGGGK